VLRAVSELGVGDDVFVVVECAGHSDGPCVGFVAALVREVASAHIVHVPRLSACGVPGRGLVCARWNRLTHGVGSATLA
jgi:hypothetical protein